MITIGVHHGAATFTPTLAFAVDTWAMIAAALAASTCGVLGCFLVLRRLSLLGDAISHSILPGIAAAFLITQSRDVGPMLLGAAVAGLLAAVLSAALSRFARVYEDASLGVSFTTLFALGVILIAFAPQVDLDPSCVLYGFLETIPLYTTSIFGFEVPRFARHAPSLWP